MGVVRQRGGVQGRGRQTLRIIDDAEDRPTDFGSAFSPDGRYWYGGTGLQILDTTTGEAVRLPVARKLAYGWTGPAELTLT